MNSSRECVSTRVRISTSLFDRLFGIGSSGIPSLYFLSVVSKKKVRSISQVDNLSTKWPLQNFVQRWWKKGIPIPNSLAHEKTEHSISQHPENQSSEWQVHVNNKNVMGCNKFIKCNVTLTMLMWEEMKVILGKTLLCLYYRPSRSAANPLAIWCNNWIRNLFPNFSWTKADRKCIEKACCSVSGKEVEKIYHCVWVC